MSAEAGFLLCCSVVVVVVVVVIEEETMIREMYLSPIILFHGEF